MPNQPDIRCLSSRPVYENPWMAVTEDLIERRDGSTGVYGVLHSPDFVVVIPFDGLRYHLVEQYRYPVKGRFWEFPQGSVAEPGLPPEQIARVELAEESGLVPSALQHLGFLHNDYGRSVNGFHAFLATGLTEGPPAREHEEQDMRSGAFTEEEIWELVAEGRLTDAASLAAWALLGRARQLAMGR
jgi:8-oxo-dGTP pyrophosphatase MutT (NUDIX family)